ncbi:MAG: hypothetical protein ILP22_05210, partial [Oscillospiraceae bacterium]|nr:hypothetical protein [Oscillospiraceae bacterium]
MSIKKITAAFMSCVLACCAVCSPFSVPAEHISAAYEGSENPCNRQDDMEVPYDRTAWVQPESWNSPKYDPRDYEGWIM